MSLVAIAHRYKKIDLAILSLLVIAWIATFWFGWVEIFEEALTNEEASHILLVPMIAGYIVWLRRGALISAPQSDHWPGLFVMLLGAFLSEYGYNSYLKALEQLGYLIVGLGAIVVAIGWRVLLPFWPALFVMLFLIPVPGRVRAEIAIPLQAWTARITESLLLAGGLDIKRLGSLLYINGQPVGIAEACNGARMVYAVFLICYAYAMTSAMRPWAKVVLLVLSPVVAIGCNIIRVVPTVLMYGFSSDEAAGVFHDLAGWGVIVVAFLTIHVLAKLATWLGIPIQHKTLPASQSSEDDSRKVSGSPISG